MLEHAISTSRDDPQLRRLLSEVDAALDRMDKNTYGLCEVCNEPIETERLVADPLIRLCLDHLTPPQQRALEADLELASRIQKGLLPEEHTHVGGWEVAYYYEAASLVSGDYCDLLSLGEDLYFVVGDVSGKGVSAALLMAHLNAMFRALVPLGMTLERVMEQASRMFCESTLPTHFATMVCGKAGNSGEIELSIAGHLPVLFLQGSGVTGVEATGLPLGMFCDEQFTTKRIQCNPGDSIFLYTDGLTEALDPSGSEYGIDRLTETLSTRRSLAPKELLTGCLSDLVSFRSGKATVDDLTMMAIRRSNPDSTRKE